MSEMVFIKARKLAEERIEKASRKKETSLDLSNLGLSFLPLELIGGLVHLTSINLQKNQLGTLPPEIGRLINLTSLDLRNNQLVSLPEEIGRLTNLTSLNLQKNELRSLPIGIGRLENLISLNLQKNFLTSLPVDIRRLKRLTSLHLRANMLGALPPEIGQLSKLTSLDLRNNQLTELPTEIGRLTKLTWLALSGNRLTALPVEIGNLANLQNLNIGDTLQSNNLERLPDEIGRLSKLTMLNLANNKLIELPPEIGQLSNLTLLNLSNNKLVALPKEIGGLIKLEQLIVGGDASHKGNNLGKLPKEIGQLTHLILLDLSNNKLTTLPPDIHNLRNLKELILEGNSLTIPPEILKLTKQPKAILDSYFSRLKKALNECKVLVVGQGGVGKTSLINRILKDTYNPNEGKTEGIDISHFNFRAKGNPYTINIWDFGGQEIMHATHQFFLTKRSFYILVVDARLTQEENRVEYWLKIILSFGGQSPILIVGSKTDQHPLDIDRTGLRKKYPNIVGVFEVSAATGAGIEKLKGAMADQIYKLPHVHDLLPTTWFTVKQQIEGLRRNRDFIDHDEYVDMCVNRNIHNSESQEILLEFLHDLGVILHFKDDPQLEALGILNPRWVTNGVYRILNAHVLFQNKGILSVEMLNNILDMPEYPSNKRIFIVELMKKFELCYDIEPNKTFLVPDLLTKDEPYTGEWGGGLAFQYHYTVLPSSIVSRFIVRMNAFIHGTIWRSGVILKSGGNTALIKADMEERKIFIWVQGDENTRRDFLSAIRHQLDAIHKTIAKLDFREKVPVPGRPNVVIDFEHLLKLERMGETTFIPEGLEQRIYVRQLLNGVESETDRLSGGVTINIGGNVDNGAITIGDENVIGRKE